MGGVTWTSPAPRTGAFFRSFAATEARCEITEILCVTSETAPKIVPMKSPAISPGTGRDADSDQDAGDLPGGVDEDALESDNLDTDRVTSTEALAARAWTAVAPCDSFSIGHPSVNC